MLYKNIAGRLFGFTQSTRATVGLSDGQNYDS